MIMLSIPGNGTRILKSLKCKKAQFKRHETVEYERERDLQNTTNTFGIIQKLLLIGNNVLSFAFQEFYDIVLTPILDDRKHGEI